MDPPPFKHTFVISIKEYELVAYRNPSYICLSYRQGEQAKNARKEKTCTITKTGRKINEKNPEQHITSTIAPFLFSSYYAVFCICLSLPAPMQHYGALLPRHSSAGRKTHFPSGNIHNLGKFRSSFSLVTPMYQERIIGKEVLVYPGAESKQGLEASHQLLGSSPLPGAGCSNSQPTTQAPVRVNAPAACFPCFQPPR